MKIKDKEVLKMIEKVRSYQLEEDIYNYPENERDGRTDVEFFADEVSYIVGLYNEQSATAEDYERAKEILSKTKYGKQNVYISGYGFRYRQSEIDEAKKSVNEYKRLCRLLSKLQSMGYYGKWYAI